MNLYLKYSHSVPLPFPWRSPAIPLGLPLRKKIEEKNKIIHVLTRDHELPTPSQPPHKWCVIDEVGNSWTSINMNNKKNNNKYKMMKKRKEKKKKQKNKTLKLGAK